MKWATARAMATARRSFSGSPTSTSTPLSRAARGRAPGKRQLLRDYAGWSPGAADGMRPRIQNETDDLVAWPTTPTDSARQQQRSRRRAEKDRRRARRLLPARLLLDQHEVRRPGPRHQGAAEGERQDRARAPRVPGADAEGDRRPHRVTGRTRRGGRGAGRVRGAAARILDARGRAQGDSLDVANDPRAGGRVRVRAQRASPARVAAPVAARPARGAAAEQGGEAVAGRPPARRGHGEIAGRPRDVAVRLQPRGVSRSN